MMVSRAERGLKVLFDVGEALDATLGVEERLARLADLVLPTLADFCTIEMIDAAGDARTVAGAAVAGEDPPGPALRAPRRAGRGERPRRRVRKGAAAAALTSLARHGIRVLSRDDPARSQVLSTLNDAIVAERGLEPRFSTVAYARIAPAGPGDALVLHRRRHRGPAPRRDVRRRPAAHPAERFRRGRPADELAQAVREAVVRHHGGPLDDDLALLVLRVIP